MAGAGAERNAFSWELGSRVDEGGVERPPVFPLGTAVGPYRLEALLGQGGFGDVYQARDPRLNRRVAIKVLGRSDERLLERFRREARILARLDHPNLVRVHDVGACDGHPYLVLDLIEGTPLSVRCEPGSLLPTREVVRLVRDAAQGIAHAHARGVLHRDLKPGNLLLEGGTVRVVDFGLAFLLEPSASRLSLSGAWVGTPAYMAPEQTGGGPPDARTDVYGLGATLYHLLCGHAPMEGAGEANPALAIHRHVPQPPSSWQAQVPPALDAICARALAKEPDERFQAASGLAAALGAWLETGAGAAAPARRRSGWGVAGAALALAASGWAGWWLASPRAAPPPAPAEVVRRELALAGQQPPGRRGDAPGLAHLQRALEAARGDRAQEVAVYREISDHHFWRCRFRESLAAIEAVLARDPDDLAAQVRRADCFQNLGRSQEGRAELERIRDAYPDTRWGAYAAADLALDELSDDAESLLSRALQIAPDLHSLWLDLGYLRLRQDRFQESGAAFERAGELQPRDPRVEIGRISLAGARYQDDEALRRVNALLEDLGQDAPPGVIAMRGKIQLGMGQLGGAARDLERALALDPDDVDLLFWHGLVELQRGNKAQAHKEWRRAHALEPEDFDRVLRRACPPEAVAEVRKIVGE